MRIVVAWGSVAALLALGLACSDVDVVTVSTHRSIEVSPPELHFDAIGAYGRVQAKVLDAKGEVVKGAMVEWEIADAAVVSMDSDNVLQSTMAGETLLVARVLGSNLEASIPVVVDPVAASLTFLVEPSDIVAGESFSPAIQVAVLDRMGFEVVGLEGEVRLELLGHGSGIELVGESVAQLQGGKASFPDLTLHHQAAGLRLLASAGGLPKKESVPFSVKAHGAPFLVFEEVVEADWGVPFDIAATLKDRFGNELLVDGASFELSLEEAKSGGILSGETRARSVKGRIHWTGLSIETTAVNPPDESCYEGIRYDLLAEGEGMRGTIGVNLRIPFVSVSGEFCGLNAAGWVYCWGSPPILDEDWRDIEDVRFRAPTSIPLAERAQFLGAGARGICVGNETGRVYCRPGVWSEETLFEFSEGMPEFITPHGELACAVTGSRQLTCRDSVGRSYEPDLAEGVTIVREFQAPYPWLIRFLTGQGSLYDWWPETSSMFLLEEGIRDRSEVCTLGLSGDEEWLMCGDGSKKQYLEMPTGEEIDRVIGKCLLTRSGRVFCAHYPDWRDWREALHPEGRRFVDGKSVGWALPGVRQCVLDDRGTVYCWDGDYLGYGMEVISASGPRAIDCTGFR